MPPRASHLRIDDILQAIARIDSYLVGMDFTQFCADQRTVDAVVRNLEVIGEAAGRVADETKCAAPEVPWKSIAAFRNVLAHEYFGIDLATIWRTVHEELPPLRERLTRLANE